MQIQASYDKVILDSAEIQRVLKEYIQSRTGRKVRGDVFVRMDSASIIGCAVERYIGYGHAFIEKS